MLRALLTLLALGVPVLLPLRGGSRDVPEPVHQARPAQPARPQTLEETPIVDPERPHSPGHGPQTTFRPSNTPREVILTFDDGPDLKTTPLVLEELDRRGLKAIFFIAGWRLLGDRKEGLARRDLVRKIAAHGHLVANHSMTHKNLCRVPGAVRDQEIDGNTELITAATGLRPLLFRSPYGAYCRALHDALEARELVDIGWNLDPQDWKGHDEETVYRYVTGKLGKISGRGILLLHDTHAASVHALPRILDWIERENARARDQGTDTLRVLDYSIYLPAHPVPPTGLETILAGLAEPFGLLPGADAAAARAARKSVDANRWQ